AHWDVFVAKIPASPDCVQKPENPFLLTPFRTVKVQGPDVKLDWTDTACAKTYEVLVRQDSKTGTLAFEARGLRKSKAVAKALIPGHTYFWRVTAINELGKGKSAWFSFKVK